MRPWAQPPVLLKKIQRPYKMDTFSDNAHLDNTVGSSKVSGLSEELDLNNSDKIHEMTKLSYTLLKFNT
jgi:hypothetical protein